MRWSLDQRTLSSVLCGPGEKTYFEAEFDGHMASGKIDQQTWYEERRDLFGTLQSISSLGRLSFITDGDARRNADSGRHRRRFQYSLYPIPNISPIHKTQRRKQRTRSERLCTVLSCSMGEPGSHEASSSASFAATRLYRINLGIRRVSLAVSIGHCHLLLHEAANIWRKVHGLSHRPFILRYQASNTTLLSCDIMMIHFRMQFNNATIRSKKAGPCLLPT